MSLATCQHENDESARNTPDVANTLVPLSRHESALHDAERGKDNDTVEMPHSIFTHKEKWFLVCLASLSALFSPFTANIYLPVIPTISKDFHKSIELINLTVTMYMVIQGLAPMFWGTLSDHRGRRPIMIICLMTLSVSCVGLALVPTSAYWLLMLLRCFQAAGSASTYALGAGIIADISTPAERAGFIGVYGVGPMVGPTLGPVIGGVLSQRFHWRATFWFLCISSTLWGLVLFLQVSPETLRAIVGNGSVPAGWIYTPPVPIVGRHRVTKLPGELPPRKPLTNPFTMLTYPDVFVLLFLNGTFFAVFYGVTASLSTSFEEVYPYLTQTDIGLCFLGIGGGMFIGTVLSGKLMDANYRKIRDNIVPQAQTEPKKAIDPGSLHDSFPIERARLSITPYLVVVYTSCVIGYGWSLQANVSIAVPLILQVIMGAAVISMMNAVTALLVDLVPHQGSSITACNNVVRCLMGAGMVTVINPIISAMGNGWAYVLLGGFCILVSPLIWVEVRWGPIWRERRLKARQDTAGPSHEVPPA
ncbi:major facilitator superfamily domain-containing protein [Lactarius vividus]|nr:major facilitator superfamily domain-containing protein [Lactarius vividus]